jgi:hypothetical protein
MAVNCPACGYYNPAGQQSCFHCSLPLPIAAAGDAVCAVHPEVKATGACSRCGTFGCGNCLSAHGPDWLCAACLGRVGKLPWDERDTLGLWRAWGRTAALMISSPNDSLRTAEPDAPLGSSLLFAVISTVVGFGPTLLVSGLISVVLLAVGGTDGLPGRLAASIGMNVVQALTLVGFQLGAVIVIAGLDHLGLTLLGAQPKSFTVTVRAYALSMGPYLLGLLPLCSLYVFVPWSVVVRIFANMHLHRTTGGKAAGAVLLPLALLCGGLFVLYFAVIALAMNQSR